MENSEKTLIPFKKTHGLSRDKCGKHTPLYSRWANIKDRCFNEKSKDFSRYGGRGIVVCEEWRGSFQAFYEWAMNNGYKEGLQLDRKDNDGPYSPENCRWATPKENSNNRRDNFKIEVNGQRKTVKEWSDTTGIPIQTIYRHKLNGTASAYISRALQRGRMDERRKSAWIE